MYRCSYDGDAGENHLRKTVIMDIIMVNGDLEGTMALFRDDGLRVQTTHPRTMPRCLYLARPIVSTVVFLAKPSFNF